MSQLVRNASPSSTPLSARFGPFELRLDTGELRKYGVRVRLQHRAFQILAALVEAPGRLVTREELRTRLWASDVFVDFESGLNTAVNRLRAALGDSAEHPVYVETLSRLGYRFLAPVEFSYEQGKQPSPASAIAVPPPPEGPELARTPPSPQFFRRSRALLSAIAAGLLVLAVTVVMLRLTPGEVSYSRLTFRKGFVSDARFTLDGQHIIYSAEWDGAPSRLFSIAPDGRRAKDLNLSNARLAGIISATEFGLFARPVNGDPPLLEFASLNGTAPQPIAGHFRSVDWGPNRSLALITAVGTFFAVQYPVGHRLYQSSQWLSDLRVSPNGKQLVFAEHPAPMDDAGHIALLDAASGQRLVLTQDWGSLGGLAWNPSGTEVWFTAAHSGVEKSLWAVNLNAQTRLVSKVPGGLELRDISRSGQILITRSSAHMTMLLGDRAHSPEQDISWLDWSRAAAISADGNTVLFDESGSRGGAGYSVFIRRRGSSSSERVAPGRAMDLSSDGGSVLAQDAADPSRLSFISVATKTTRPVPSHGFVYRWSKFFPDAREILVFGHYPGKPDGIYRQRLTEPPQLVNPLLQLDDAVIEPSGRFAAGASEKCEIVILNLADGHIRTISLPKMAYPVLFLDSGRLLIRGVDRKSIPLSILDTATGHSTPFRRIDPADSTGIAQTFPIQFARDLETYVYSRVYVYSDLFLVSGLS
ncbi:MAG: winged helix-turn-helix domain-containing protein [Acetobacteraceae bacterium]|nr:winged helix-turn-helix domain-containing protein [Acetobacteraceae bacterium]